MLNDSPCVGISRTNTSKSATSQRQPTVSCSQTNARDHLPVTSHSVDTTFRNLLKRPRSLEDIAGEEGHTQRKKRRLRLELVTSRLSRPYATPATHIIGTKAWRVGAWARQRFAGGKLLRKAAILNWISFKSKRGPLGAMKISECSTGRAASTYGHTYHWSSSDANCSRLHPSPGASRSPQRAFAPPATYQMQSDYDAFDHEDDIVEENEEEDDEEENNEDSSDEESQPIHSDFRQLESSDTDPDFFDTSWSFVNIEANDPEVDPGGMEIKLVMENEKQSEVSVAPFRPEMFSSLHTRTPVMSV